MSQMFRVTAQFVRKGTGKPITGIQYIARLYDEDPLSDDLLGEKSPDDEGRVEFLSDALESRSLDSPLEERPDLYVALFEDGTEVFRTPVAQDVNIEQRHPVTGELTSLTIDLGTHHV